MSSFNYSSKQHGFTWPKRQTHAHGVKLLQVCETAKVIFQREKNKHVICRPRSVRIGKNCALGLEHGRTQDLGHSFSQYGPPGRQITYIYLDMMEIYRLFIIRAFYD